MVVVLSNRQFTNCSLLKFSGCTKKIAFCSPKIMHILNNAFYMFHLKFNHCKILLCFHEYIYTHKIASIFSDRK